jgi:predicted ATPase
VLGGDQGMTALSFSAWNLRLGVGRTWHAGARVMAGDFSALPEIMDGMALVGETGSQGGAPALFALLAEAQRAAGQLAEAQGTVTTALAAACYHRALAIARDQGARSLELRAATSLARLWRDQGKRAEARALLAPVYAWFTEGFNTRDLIDAKTLLDELK